jgi:predicted HD superfamily hydrolase involved in NAD metabolism
MLARRRSRDVVMSERLRPMMHPMFIKLVQGISWTNDVRADMVALLSRHGHPETAEHCTRVGKEAARLAARFGVDRSSVRLAGWLHDISAVFPAEQRSGVARKLGVEVLPQEEIAPMILHQKLSAVMARQIFGVADRTVLSAIECHTTLKADPSAVDKMVFAADKIAWDQPGTPPYLQGMLRALDRSLDEGVLYYLDYLWQRRHALLVVHPWFVDAYRQYRTPLPPR